MQALPYYQRCNLENPILFSEPDLIKLFVFVFAPEAAIDPFGLGQG